MTAAGVDTVSFAWRPSTEDVLDRFRAEPHRPGPAGSLLLDRRGPGDERLILFPAYGVLSMEGRLGAMIDRSDANHDLTPGRALPTGAGACGDVLRDTLGYEPHRLGDICEVRRYDLASELRFEDGRDGLAFLRTLGGMCPPRAKLDAWKSPDGHIETVYVRTPKRGVVLMRAYDKGIEAGTNAPGERLRVEAQLRPAKSRRMTPETLASTDLRSHFIGRMASYVNDTNGTIAAGSTAAVDHLLGKVARDELGLAKAERMIGSLVVLREHGRAIYEDRQGRRRLADLRNAGVALEHELPPDRVVPVGQLLRDAMEAFTA